MNLDFFCSVLCNGGQQKLTLSTRKRIFIAYILLLCMWVCMYVHVCLGVVVLGWEFHGVNQKLEGQA